MYMEITFEESSPEPTVGEDNVCAIIGRVTSFSGSDNWIEASTLTSLQNQGVTSSTGAEGYRAAEDFFAGNGLMPRSSKLLFYAYDDSVSSLTVTKEDVLGDLDGSNRSFKVRASPVSFSGVYIQWESGGDYVAQPSLSYETIADGSTIQSGEITFNDGDSFYYAPGTWAGPADLAVGGDYAGARIVADYTIDGLGKVLKELREKNVSTFMFAYDENASGIEAYTGDTGSWALDQIVAAKECLIAAQEGKSRLYVMALPKGAKATDTVPSSLRNGISSFTYEQLSTFLGGNPDVAAIGHDVTEANSVPVNNVTGQYSGIICGQDPMKKGFVMQDIGISQTTFPSSGEIAKFNNAQIACVFNQPDIYPTDVMITYGYTFGSGTSARIENRRCKHKIAREVRATTIAFIRSRDSFMDEEGCMALNSAYRGLFKRLKADGVCDGLKSIDNPLLTKLSNSNRSAADEEYIEYYLEKRWIPNVALDYLWRGNPEYINVTVKESSI